MSVRYPHYLRAVSGSKFPPVVICVSFHHAIFTDSPGAYPPKLGGCSWSATVLKLDKTVYCELEEASGNDHLSWWNFLAELKIKPKSRTIISGNAKADLGLVRFFEMVENGTIRLDIDDDISESVAQGKVRSVRGDEPLVTGRVRSITKRSKKDRSYGRVILEGPPDIVSFSTVGHPEIYLWIGIENYSFGARFAGLSALDDCAAIVDWFLAATGVVRICGLGSWQNTTGSQAMHGWKKSYLKHLVYAHNLEPALRLEGEAYVGGRCQAFRNGKIEEPVWVLDFRSMYPSVCLDAKLPCRIASYNDQSNPFELRRAMDQYQVIADVELNTDLPLYPHRVGEDIKYPLGVFRTTLCGPELEIAIDRNHIIDCHALATYEGGMIFHEFMHKLYQMRISFEEANKPQMASYVKRILVSLPGKFGQRNREWKTLSGAIAPTAWGEWYGTGADGLPTRFRALAGIVQRAECNGYSPDSIVSVAAWVNSLARVKLLDAIEVCGWGNVYYVDTDSIFTNEQGYGRLANANRIIGSEIGQMSVRAVKARVEFSSPKHYSVDGKITGG